MQDFNNYIFHLDSKTKELTRKPITKEERVELITRLNKWPGEQNLDERINLANERATFFLKNKYYINVVPKSRDYISFWEREKQIIYGGLLIDNEFYITGDHYWYLNYIFIPDKVKKKDTFPRIFDTDIWWFQKIEYANLTGVFTATVKKRQMGFSLKAVSRLTKRFWFEEGFVGRIIAWDEKYVKDSWSIHKKYSKYLNRQTAWKRPITGEKMDITQEIKMEDGTFRGNGSKLQGLTFKTNPGKVVGGKVDEFLLEEYGAAPNADVVLELANSALKFGNISTGNFHGIGAVTELKYCKPLKDVIYNPEDNGFLATPNIHSNRPEESVGLFVPEKYSYGTCIDEFGNSLMDEALKSIAEEEERQKKKSYKSFMVYKSQHPNTLEDAFASREENDFPVGIIQPWYDKLSSTYNPLKVTITEESYGLTHNIGCKHDVVEDFPVKKDTLKTGAVVIDEAPKSNPPFGLYYAGIDTITPIKSTVSKSLQSIYIYKAAHELDGEYTQDTLVAWFAGRADSPYDTYKTTRDLIKYYNARALIENDNRNFIEWMIGQKCQKYMMKRNEIALGKDLIARSSIDTSEYGSRTQNIKTYLIGLGIAYCEEEIGVRFNEETGESRTIYGVERIKDKMLLKEMLEYSPKKNVDRIMAFCITLLAAKSNTNRGLKVKSNNTKKSEEKRVNYKKELANSSLKHKRNFRSTFLK